MVKKRPRAARRAAPVFFARASKNDPAYWRDRLYRNTFTYQGNSYEVGHWSVKIQHRGTRKTFSLQAPNRSQAAAEACKLYKNIVIRGWENTLARSNGKAAKTRRGPDAIAVPRADGPAASYWAERLIHRKYTETLRPGAERELSVRIDHRGTGHYFPLGTDSTELAARRATRIYRTIAGRGWANACKRFPRELSVAFRWSDNPLAWTYTTVHTQTDSDNPATLTRHNHPSGTLKVAIVESDSGLRQALSRCINQQEGCYCAATFATGDAALEAARNHLVDVLLAGQNLSDKSGTAFLKELKKIAAGVFGLLFSVFEDSEQLFKAAPGGAPSYIFRRTPPARILAPIESALKDGSRALEQFNKRIRHFFEGTVVSFPLGGSANELSNLTPREHEILALLSKGHPDKEIADLLRISTWTVHGHLKKIFEKLKAHNRTDAVVKYLNK